MSGYYDSSAFFETVPVEPIVVSTDPVPPIIVPRRMETDLDQFESGSFDDDRDKAEFIAHMDKLKAMGVEESTFHKKFEEVKEYRYLANKATVVENRIWKPTEILDLQRTTDEIRSLKPRIFYVDPSNDGHMTDWLMLRVFCHTMAYDQTPGRFLRFLVIDDVSGQYLGAASLSNDVMALTCRDDFIGWSSVDRIGKEGLDGERDGKLIHSAIGSCIMGTQPFGYNFLGGKLVASLILSKYVRDTWETVVGKKLVGMTTTSLYGPNSMYCGIPYWNGCGVSQGKISLKPDDVFYDKWHDIIKRKFPEKYKEKIEKVDPSKGPITGIKQRILDMIFKEAGTASSNYHHGFERGVYYAPFYEETKPFLCNKLNDVTIDWTPIKRFETDSVGMIEWWRSKALKRYTKLHAENRLKPEVLFYSGILSGNDGSGLSYDEAKAKYFDEIGR